MNESQMWRTYVRPAMELCGLDCLRLEDRLLAGMSDVLWRERGDGFRPSGWTELKVVPTGEHSSGLRMDQALYLTQRARAGWVAGVLIASQHGYEWWYCAAPTNTKEAREWRYRWISDPVDKLAFQDGCHVLSLPPTVVKREHRLEALRSWLRVHLLGGHHA